MNEVKYLVNTGFEADEVWILSQLSKLASEGWLLETMNSVRFELVKSEPQKLIYVVDYQPKNVNKRLYLESMTKYGWKYVCGSEGFYLFYTPEGIRRPPLDRTQLDKRIQLKKRRLFRLWFAGILCLLLFLVIGSSFLTEIRLLGVVTGALLFGYAGAGLLRFRKRKGKISAACHVNSKSI